MQNWVEDSMCRIMGRRLTKGNRLSQPKALMKFCAAFLLFILAALSSLAWADHSMQLTGALMALAGLLAMSVGEVSERLLYFSSVVHDRMPGTMP